MEKTLRDEIAIEILKRGVHVPITQSVTYESAHNFIAKHCYDLADAMMEARK